MDLPPTQSWIKAATVPLTDNPELQLAAQHELEELSGPADATELATLERRFEELNDTPPSIQKRRRILRHGLIALPLLIIVVLYLTDGRSLLNFTKSISSIGGSWGQEQPSPPESVGLTSEERLLLWGDPTAPTEELQWKALWDSDPANPAYFSQYINACDPLPANFLTVAREIDPDNGWFLLVKAGELAKEAVEKIRTRKPRPDLSLPPHERFKIADEVRQVSEWKIKDPALLQEALALLHEAASKPRLECYDDIIIRKQLNLLPPETDLASRLVRVVHAASFRTPQLFSVLHLTKGISAASVEMSNSEDQEALRVLIADNNALTLKILQSGDSLVRQLVNLSVVFTTQEHLLDAAEKADLTTEATLLWPKVLAIREYYYERKMHGTVKENSVVRKHASLFHSLAIPTVGKVASKLPDPTPEELKPSRMADYAIAERVTLFLGAVLLTLCSILGCLLYPVSKGKLSRNLGTRLAQAFTPIDYLWITLLGILSPIAWYFLICKTLPLGGRDLGLAYFIFQPFGLQVAITACLLIVGTAQAIRWRFQRHYHSLETGPRHPKLAWLFPILIALSLPLTGFCALLFSNDTGNPNIIVYLALALPSLLLAYLIWILIRSTFGNRRHAPYRVALTSVLAPAFALSSLFLLALYPATIAEERYWIAQDSFGQSSAENLGMPRLERDAAQALRTRLLNALTAE